MSNHQYIDVFLDESHEHLQAINDNLLSLEKQPENLEIVNEIFRSAHTLKGMAATMEFTDLASLTHQMENVLDDIRNEELTVTTEVIDLTFEAVEALEEMVDAIAEGGTGEKDISDLVARLEQIGSPSHTEQSQTQAASTIPAIELDEYEATVVNEAKERGFSVYQISIELIDDCMLKAARVFMVFDILEEFGEVIKTVPPTEDLEEEKFDHTFSLVFLSKETAEAISARIYKVSEIEHVQIDNYTGEKSAPKTEKSQVKQEKSAQDHQHAQRKTHQSKTIRVNMERIDALMNLFEEVVIDRGRLEDLAENIDHQELTDTVEHLSRISASMQDLILTMRMVPIEKVFNRFPRMVRGLAKDLDKQVDLEIVGSETELDRTVIDEIGDPLVHLIRNSVDHGIETPAKRKEIGKPEEGKLTLRAFHSGNDVFIEVEDDGAGIDRKKVIRKAIDNGVIAPEQSENMRDDEIYQLILSSGFSTAHEISDISGRGVGLDVVRTKIESLGGRISIASYPGKGSKFTIQLPLTLSIMSVLLVNVQKETYGIPLSSVVETVLLPEEQVMFAHGKRVIDFRGDVTPLVFLEDVFNVPKNVYVEEQKYIAIVIVNKGDKRTGLVVDSFIGQQEVVLKSLGHYLQDVPAISGATILGDGRVSLIIDPNELIT